ncbi:hypothetical protein [Quadrisphaera sp. INWT6]|uniref:hypothetical protein n=1 Tax=Quadrisphaera sp. INWT6 TaxID=2596917 RepID=UPI001892364F|nr:hypothetical protein [Quadrisphaera sp. INWT6]MBF5081391.1 hypothetical protein [Quadrisphaera sp. INWT6]
MDFIPGVSRLEHLSGSHINAWLSIKLQGAANEQLLQAPIISVTHRPGDHGNPMVTELRLSMNGGEIAVVLPSSTSAHVIA